MCTIDQELDHVVEELEKIAVVNHLQHRSIISLIGNVQRSSLILEKVLYNSLLLDTGRLHLCTHVYSFGTNAPTSSLHSAFTHLASKEKEFDLALRISFMFLFVLQNDRLSMFFLPMGLMFR